MVDQTDQQVARTLLSLVEVIESAIHADPSKASDAEQLMTARAAIHTVGRARYKPSLRVLRATIKESKDNVCKFLSVQAIDFIINGPIR